MSGAEQTKDRWTFGTRFVEGQIDRAKWRNTMTVRIAPRLSVGVEFNPLASDWSPLANWLAVEETERRPALIFGTSSDRIGTSHGQSFYGTLSKNLEKWIKIPIAPYAGATYGTYDDKFRAIGGANIQWMPKASSLIIFDGVDIHPTFSWTEGRHVLTFLLVDMEHPGVSYSYSFDTHRK